MEENNTQARAAAVAEKLLSALERAVEELSAVVATRKEKKKTDDGEVMTEYQVILPEKQGAVDLAALRQLSGVMKDMREAFGIDSPGEAASGMTVSWEGDTHDCAE